MSQVLVAITGASGGLYGVRLVQRLLAARVPTAVVLSRRGRQVLALEHDLVGDPAEFLAAPDGTRPVVLDNQDMAASPASGSSGPQAMIVVPCSMGTAARIATGVSGSLIERAADVVLKERRRLVLVPRETPLSTLHLRNLLALSELGAIVVPAAPAFYARPQGIEDLLAFVVDRALAAAGLDLPLRTAWRAPASGAGDPEAAPSGGVRRP